MSEKDQTAIEIVRDLQQSLRATQSNIRNTTLAMVGILLIAVLGAVFWGGAIDNKVDTNEKNIDKLTDVVNDYINESRIAREKYLKETDMIPFQQAWNEMAINWGHISFWAETKGYEPLTRSQKDAIKKTKVD